MKSYKNIGTLDIRKVTDEALLDIKELVNIGTLIMNEGQQEKMGHITQRNVGESVAIPDGEDVAFVSHNGDYTIDQAFLSGLNRYLYLSINGRLLVKELEDTTNLRYLKKASINGEAFIPSSISATFCAVATVNGTIISYENGDLLLEKPLVLSEDALWGIKPNSVVRAGEVIALEALNMEEVSRHLAKLHIRETLVATRENMRLLAPLVEGFMDLEKHIVPDGYAYFSDLSLDQNSLNVLKDRKLYVAGTLKIVATADEVLEKVDGVICNTLKIDQETFDQLKPILEKVEKVKLTGGSARENYGALKLSEEGLADYRGISFANYGALKFDASVKAETIKEAFKEITNYGVIKCPEGIRGALLTKVSANYGVVKGYNPEDESSDQQKDKESDHLSEDVDGHGWKKEETVIGNVSSITL